jgi:hypothetical protein
MKTGPLASTIVKVVLDELESRAGFDHWWDDIDADVQEEISDELKLKVLALLEAHADA